MTRPATPPAVPGPGTALTDPPEPSTEALAEEVDRLAANGLEQAGFDEDALYRLAVWTLKIEALKRERDAVIPAHVYQRPEIQLGVADMIGDSYKLARDCAATSAETIVFAGVRFMAETAKILNPEKLVLLPAVEAGCSLAESIRAEDVRRLREQYPGAPAVCYINTDVAVKAECDTVVTSANAVRILEKLFAGHRQVIFLPDVLMGRNLARQLDREIGEELIIWDGTCIVHEQFDSDWIEEYRRRFPGVKILAHSECSAEVAGQVDFLGGTGDMLRYVEGTDASGYMLVTECGLGELARSRYPDKVFIPMCRLCPYMKATELARIYQTLKAPRPEQVIEVDAAVAERARHAIEEMFRLAE